MGGSYRQCGECGKRALSIATRCPGCGRELPVPAGPEDGPAVELARYVQPGVAGLVAVAAVLVAMEIGGSARVSDQTDSPATAESRAADSIAASSEVAYAIGGTARLDRASVEATPPAELLVARTWTNVRLARSRRAELGAVLMPGDTVLADSLQRDWYRVALDGEVMGYAHRSTLQVP